MATDNEQAEQDLLNKIPPMDGEDEVKPAQEDYQPMYRVYEDTKIPIAKSSGKMWQNRRDQAAAKMRSSGAIDAWDEAVRYYRNDQAPNKSSGGDGAPTSSKSSLARTLSETWTETENVVFSNISALVPSVYAKNPDAEVSANKTENFPGAKMIEKLLDTLAAKKSAPGLNLKPKMRRAVIMAALTNVAFIEVGYNFKEQGSEAALEELGKLATELEKAKSPQEIKEIEGKLQALEYKIDLLSPSGPWVKFRRPHDVHIDPDATFADLSDAAWVMIADYIATDYIRAMYGKKNEKGEWDSIYMPSNVLKIGNGGDAAHDNLDSFHLMPWSSDAEYSKHGYADQTSYERACRTKVWYVWDKTTRRMMMFNDKDWTYPIWVWDDPYHLDNFFPLVPLEFYMDPDEVYARSETSYYLDQQDAINDMNSEMKRIRDWTRGKIVYNTNVFKSVDDVEQFINGERRMLGVAMDTSIKLEQVFHALTPPSESFIKYFDKRPYYEAINKLSGIPQMMTGVEYKTNTTNRAIESYESQMQTRLDEKMDAIEDCVGNVLWMVAQMCLQFMEQEQVGKLIGQEYAQSWRQLTPEEITQVLSIRIVGGSAIKPTSRAKKEQAMQLSQMMGQFASATPFAIVIMLKLIERAFDDVQITEEEWKTLNQTIMMQLQRGNSDGQGGGEGGEAAPPQADPRMEAEAKAKAAASKGKGVEISLGQNKFKLNGTGMEEILQTIETAVDKLPAEMKQKMGEMLGRGTSMRDVISHIANTFRTGGLQ